MAFAKTGISISSPRAVKNPDQLLQPGDKREGKVWDGEKWITAEDWIEAQQKKSV